MKKTILLMIILLTALTVLIRPVYAIGDIIGPDVIYKDSNEIVNINDITSLYNAASAGILIHEDNFTGSGHIVGNHKITLKATDGLAEKFKEITIIVTYNKIPDVTIENTASNLFRLVGVTTNNYTFVTQNDKSITVETIRDTLINLNLLTIYGASSKNILLDTYTTNKETPGTYILNFRIMDTTGAIRTFNTNIVVQASADDWQQLDPGGNSINLDFGFVGTIVSIIMAIAVAVGVVIVFKFMYKKFNKNVRKRG